MSRIHYAPSHRPFFPSLCNLIKAAVTHLARVLYLNFSLTPVQNFLSRSHYDCPPTPIYCASHSRENASYLSPVFEGHTISARNGSRGYNKLSHISPTRIEVEASDCAKTREV